MKDNGCDMAMAVASAMPMLKMMAMPFLRPLQPSFQSFQEGLRRTPPLVFAMAVLSAGLIGASAVAVKGVRSATNAITVTGASTERVDTRVMHVIYAIQGNDPNLYVGQQVDVYLDTGK